MDSKTLSTVAITDFVSFYKFYSRGALFKGTVEVYSFSEEKEFSADCEGSFSHNYRTDEDELQISYSFGDDVMRRIGLRGIYGTNYYSFSFEKENLIIVDEENEKVLKIKVTKNKRRNYR